ncbi:hypothetical protein HYFRA_00006257 [Hymenoscyphus fraxineus]|uniref:Aminotransferase class V domain-containing protein n=1 Tax=Hymenoscyphus fraxineus TaxID=746836 RepID=A0A9N9Q1F4_9HELO|nr:hypothetical protein HYFRA_00006257 [Hymenoscyphus fraxineus]
MPTPLNRPIQLSAAPETPQGEKKYERVPFGKEMLKQFSFDPEYTNINHGSFGAFPEPIRDIRRQYMDAVELSPDIFIRYTYPKLLNKNRLAAARFLDAPDDTVVLVPNATTGINTVLRNLEWNKDGKDEILYFNTIYGSCGNTISYICESLNHLVNSRGTTLTYPLSDAQYVDLFKSTIATSRSLDKRPRLALFDTISSLPGVRVPFEALTKVCKEEGILSLIDGAHGIGHIPLSLRTLAPDFFVSNVHKWLGVPRGCAVLYVPVENQGMMRSTLPTGHGFKPRDGRIGTKSSLPPSEGSEFVGAYEMVGSIDSTPYLTISASIKWRLQACGGEEAIRTYCIDLAHRGGQLVADILGTYILDNEEHTMTNCCMTNVLLPLNTKPISSNSAEGNYHLVKADHDVEIVEWMQKTVIDDHKMFIPVYFMQGRWWTRLSAQVYLEMKDFEWAGRALKDLCERVGRGEFLK